MPILNIDVSTKCNDEQKKELTYKLTKYTTDSLNIPAEKIIVIINEHKLSNYGRGGISSDDKEFGKLSRRKSI